MVTDTSPSRTNAKGLWPASDKHISAANGYHRPTNSDDINDQRMPTTNSTSNSNKNEIPIISE
eukprot:6480314-Amphidinium_carterae.1